MTRLTRKSVKASPTNGLHMMSRPAEQWVGRVRASSIMASTAHLDRLMIVHVDTLYNRHGLIEKIRRLLNAGRRFSRVIILDPSCLGFYCTAGL